MFSATDIVGDGDLLHDATYPKMTFRFSSCDMRFVPPIVIVLLSGDCTRVMEKGRQ